MSEQIIITILIAVAGSYAGYKLKFPVGTLTGAIVAVGLVQVLTGYCYFPAQVKTISSSLIGTYLGARVKKEDIRVISGIPHLIFGLSAVLIAFGFLAGIFLSHVMGIDLQTALFATAPGGITEMSIAAMDAGCNPAIVSTIQLLRLIPILLFMPGILKYLLRHRKHPAAEAVIREISDREAEPVPDNKGSGTLGSAEKWKRFGITLLIGMTAGVIGKLLNVPSGSITFAMLATATYNVLTGKAFVFLPVRWGAQCCNGALIGIRLSMDGLMLIWDSIGILMLLTLCWMLLAILTGYFIYRVSDLSLETAMFATTPGGMSDMGLISAEMGGNTTQVSIFHMVRVFSVIAVVPFLAAMAAE